MEPVSVEVVVGNGGIALVWLNADIIEHPETHALVPAVKMNAEAALRFAMDLAECASALIEDVELEVEEDGD